MGCRWVASSKLPKGVVDIGEMAWTDVPPNDVNVDSLHEDLIKSIILQGEEAADAFAMVSDFSYAYSTVDGVTYCMYGDDEHGYGLMQYACGLTAAMPWMLVGGLVGSVSGFALAHKMADNGIMGATLGFLAGAGAGYGVQHLKG